MFRTHHALRIKGFAPVTTVAEVAGHEIDTAQQHLDHLREQGHAQFREARELWQLTVDGKAAHVVALAADVARLDRLELRRRYEPFLALNVAFKALCGDWQLRGGAINDHSDPDYDGAVVARFGEFNAAAQPVVVAFAQTLTRFSGYGPRLAETYRKVVMGETKMLTGVMCGSYHDVWMELHEDLILTQGIDRTEEGSF